MNKLFPIVLALLFFGCNPKKIANEVFSVHKGYPIVVDNNIKESNYLELYLNRDGSVIIDDVAFPNLNDIYYVEEFQNLIALKKNKNLDLVISLKADSDIQMDLLNRVHRLLKDDKVQAYKISYSNLYDSEGINIVLPAGESTAKVRYDHLTKIIVDNDGRVIFQPPGADKTLLNANELYRIASLTEEQLIQNKQMIFSVMVTKKSEYSSYIKVLDYLKQGNAKKIAIVN